MSIVITLPPMRLHVHESGDPAGEPVLAIHGVTGHSRRYDGLAETALADRRVLAVDLRGHGRSGWEPPWDAATHVTDLIDTLDAAGPTEPIDVVGHSFGGLLALTLLRDHPERVRRLVLLDPAIALPPEACAERADQVIAFRGWDSPDHAIEQRALEVAESGRHAIPAEIAEHVVVGPDGRFRGRFSRPAAVAAWSAMAHPAPLPASVRPVLVIEALHAGYVREDTLLGPLRAILGQHLDHVVLECGHMVYWEALGETADAIERFWAVG